MSIFSCKNICGTEAEKTHEIDFHPIGMEKFKESLIKNKIDPIPGDSVEIKSNISANLEDIIKEEFLLNIQEEKNEEQHHQQQQQQQQAHNTNGLLREDNQLSKPIIPTNDFNKISLEENVNLHKNEKAIKKYTDKVASEREVKADLEIYKSDFFICNTITEPESHSNYQSISYVPLIEASTIQNKINYLKHHKQIDEGKENINTINFSNMIKTDDSKINYSDSLFPVKNKKNMPLNKNIKLEKIKTNDDIEATSHKKKKETVFLADKVLSFYILNEKMKTPNQYYAISREISFSILNENGITFKRRNNSHESNGSISITDSHSCVICKQNYLNSLLTSIPLKQTECKNCKNVINQNSLDFYLDQYRSRIINAKREIIVKNDDMLNKSLNKKVENVNKSIKKFNFNVQKTQIENKYTGLKNYVKPKKIDLSFNKQKDLINSSRSDSSHKKLNITKSMLDLKKDKVNLVKRNIAKDDRNYSFSERRDPSIKLANINKSIADFFKKKNDNLQLNKTNTNKKSVQNVPLARSNTEVFKNNRPKTVNINLSKYPSKLSNKIENKSKVLNQSKSDFKTTQIDTNDEILNRTKQKLDYLARQVKLKNFTSKLTESVLRRTNFNPLLRKPYK